MIPYQIYKIVHIVSLFGVFMCLGALIIHGMNGGARNHPARRWLIVSFSVFMFLTLTGGFGLLARVGTGMQPWVYAKLALWLVVGAFLSVIVRKPQWARANWFVLVLLGITGAWLALYKPF